MRKVLLPVIIMFQINHSFGQGWMNVGNGLNWNVYDLTSFDDNLYAAGRLGIGSSGVFFWNGNSWINTGRIYGIHAPLTIEKYNGELYTSGDFPVSNGDPTKVLKWRNGNWEQQGNLFSGASWNSVKKLKTYNGFLFAGGKFRRIGSTQARNIAMWDGTKWDSLGKGLEGIVTRMEIFNGKLAVCHQVVDTIEVNGTIEELIYRSKIQLWDNNSWEDLDSTFNNKDICLLGIMDSSLVFSSQDTVHGIVIESIGKWDGRNISSIGDSLFSSVYAVNSFKGELYAASRINSLNSFVIRKLINGQWVTVGQAFNNYILSLEVHAENLFCAGFFNEYDSQSMKYISVLGISTSVNNKIRKEIKVFPVPAEKKINIESDNFRIATYKIFSIDMKELISGNLSGTNTIEIGYLPPSLYILQLKTKEGFKKYFKIEKK